MVAQKYMIFLAENDHLKNLSVAGLKVNGIALFIGKPTVGKLLFLANKAIGLVVPVRLNVFDNDDGRTYFNNLKLSYQLATFANDEIKMVANMLDENLQKSTFLLAKISSGRGGKSK
jgi:uncharacterized protein (DUF302 family)